MHLTYNQIVKRFQQLVTHHRQLNHFYYGSLADFPDVSTVNYPCSALELSPASISQGQTAMTFDLFLGDRVNITKEHKRNEQDVLSDLLQIAEDISAMIKSPGYQSSWVLSGPISIRPTRDETPDVLLGVLMTISIITPNFSDRCAVPTTMDFEADEFGDLPDFDIRNMKVEKYPYLGQGTEGATLTLATVANKEILLLLQGDKILTEVTTDAELVPGEYRYTALAGGFEFGAEIEYQQQIQILYRNS